MRMWGVRRCSGAAVAGAAPADFLFGEERTAADGTAAVQLAVSLVCGDGDGRGGVEPRGVQQESGAAAERGDRRGVFPAGTRPGPAVFVGRAFYGGRDEIGRAHV